MQSYLRLCGRLPERLALSASLYVIIAHRCYEPQPRLCSTTRADTKPTGILYYISVHKQYPGFGSWIKAPRRYYARALLAVARCGYYAASGLLRQALGRPNHRWSG